MACTGNKNSYFSEEEKEDSNAKEMLQGIWLDDETESPLMRVEGDTIYYADVQSTPIAFKIIRDTLYTYGNDTTYYKIDKQAEHIFWFHSITDDVIKLHKSEDANDSIYFVRQELVIPAYTEVTKRDSVVTYNGTRYRAYVYINPSKMRVIKTTYSILSDTKFMKVDRNGFHYQAVLAIPETSIYSIVNMEVSFKGDLTITSSK